MVRNAGGVGLPSQQAARRFVSVSEGKTKMVMATRTLQDSLWLLPPSRSWILLSAAAAAVVTVLQRPLLVATTTTTKRVNNNAEETATSEEEY
jgi:hypothetical protein